MRILGGLRREDWEHWGEGTTFKQNAPELLRKTTQGTEIVYCSPLVDPWQPAEKAERMMPEILDALFAVPPKRVVFQTRGPGVRNDIDRILRLSARTDVRVSFSITTDRDDIRRIYEPHCEPNSERLEVVRALTAAGIRTYVTLAPLLPCNPEQLAEQALEAGREDIICDPLHLRQTKPAGATTRSAAFRIAAHHGHGEYFEPAAQTTIVKRIRDVVEAHGRKFATGTEGFSWLSQK